MASEMVVRVAKAICRVNCEGEMHPCDMKDGQCKPYGCILWKVHADSARAAIEAMQPTREMMEAGAKSGSCLISSYRDTSDHVGEFGIAFKAMITEALKEPASPAVRREGEGT